MARLGDRWPDNAPGRFFVDTGCIVCKVCSELAPDHFRLSEAEDHDVVYAQPHGDEQVAACREALAACPVDAIGEAG